MIQTQGALLIAIGLPLLASSFSRAADAVVQHELIVHLDPEGHSLRVKDTITLPPSLTENGKTDYVFEIHRGLSPSASPPGAKLKKTPGHEGDGISSLAESFTISLPPGQNSFILQYEGPIFHALDDESRVAPSGVQGTSGQIGPEGVFLSGITGWYPRIGGLREVFTLDVSLPPGWASVSQGVRTDNRREEKGSYSRWEEKNPQDEIYLIAAPFTEYQRAVPGGTAHAFLRAPDPRLADRYLEATEEFLDLYSRMLGRYPYKKFALVENFWETGFGMPSFTLLGPRVIRLPFILRSSYPHEILHNWWGNGVFLSPDSGNWSEGLTSYLADHYFQEEAGEGASYRRNSLQKYTDFVSGGTDFPLSDFRGRNNPATEAVGYGKTLMLFHMLRRDMGNTVFLKGLRIFLNDHLFQRASFDDIRASFEKVSGRKLKPFFDQWVRRKGAPELSIQSAKVEPDGKGFRLTLTLEQTQDGPPYRITIPAAFTLRGREEVLLKELSMDRKIQSFEVYTEQIPLRLDIDPEFDLFRRLDATEVPPALTQMIGAEETLFLLPSKPDHRDNEGYRQLAETLGRRLGKPFSILVDSEVQTLPPGKAVWVLGWENRFSPGKAPGLDDRGFRVSEKDFHLGAERYTRDRHALALTVERDGPGSTLGWIAAQDPDSLAGLARKLPHYGPYGFLVFQGKEADNVAKKRWPVLRSALSVSLNEGEFPARGRIPPYPPLSSSF